MKVRELLTQKRLKELLHYNPETGVFTWKVNRGPAREGKKAGSVETRKGYQRLTIRADYKLYFAHQLVFLYMTGKLPEKGKEVDHIDGDTSNDRWENLRIVARRYNQLNRHTSPRGCTGVRGVSVCKKSKKFRAYIGENQTQIYLGHFPTLEEAKTVREQALAEAWRNA